MWPALLLLVAEPHVINVQERVPLTLVVSTPTGQVADVSKSELIRIVNDLVKRHTDFFPQELDELVVEDCKGRLTCLALKSRRGYDPSAPQPTHLLLISNVSIADGADRLSIALLDLEAALRIERDAERRPGWQDDVEATISEEAVLAPPLRGEVGDAQEAITFLARAFTRELAGKLEESGHWEPYGDLEIECSVAGAAIKLDGAGVGSTVDGITRLAGARPGTRELELIHPDFLPYRASIEVRRGRTARAEAELAIAASNTTGVVRRIVLFGGVATAAAGVAVAIAAAVQQGGAQTSCFAPCETGSEFQTFGYDESAAGGLAPVNPGGVAVAPLGFALAGTGLVWSLGTWLLGDDDDFPWIQLVAGAVAGGATYALSVLLDDSTPEVQ